MEELQTPYITPVLNEVGYYFSLPTYYLPKFVVRRSSRGVANGGLMHGINNLETDVIKKQLDSFVSLKKQAEILFQLICCKKKILFQLKKTDYKINEQGQLVEN